MEFAKRECSNYGEQTGFVEKYTACSHLQDLYKQKCASNHGNVISRNNKQLLRVIKHSLLGND